jgi:uncharacterized membrane protein YwaF
MVNVRDFLNFLTTSLLIILHVVLLVIAIRVYVAERSRAAGLLLLACIAYTLARFAWFGYDLAIDITSLPMPKSKSATLGPWSFYSIRFFHVAFMALAVLTFRAMKRGAPHHLTKR